MDREVTRGDTPKRAYKLFNLETEPLDLAGHTVWLTVKSIVDNDLTDANAILRHYIQLDLSGAVVASHGFELGGKDPDPMSDTFEQVVSGATSGVVTHVLPVEDSVGMPIGSFLYDLQVMGPPDVVSGDSYIETPVLSAKFVVRGDITRRTTTP